MEIPKELERFRPLIEEMTPCGVTPEEALDDKTDVWINSPRALLMCAFQENVRLLRILEARGLLK